MKKYRMVLGVLSAFLLSGCAAIFTGSQQSVSVDTEPAGAACTLSNREGTWHIPSTPGTVTITRNYGDLTIYCNKAPYQGISAVTSHTKGLAFGNILLGFGGILGAAVDMGTGAAYDYPTIVTIPLRDTSKRSQ